ncbi:ice-binding family protein [Pontibacter ruber]|uniref:Ice-binding family protein n=1 Tax=Pontibacter ruber TaxID=1343895 RepID=A0ABW5CWP7_9BACT|nr:ice-binding family protein [Pontibacter ruber]
MISFSKKVILALVGFWLATTVVFAQQAPSLGALYDFSALGYTKVSNTGSTVISANLGVAAGSITGFPPGTVLRGKHENDAVAKQANLDAIAAFNNAAGRPVTATYSNANLGKGQLASLSPGVYELNGNTLLSGELILDGENNPNALFIFHVKGSLDIANYSQMTLKRDASSAYVYWVIDGGVTAGISTVLKGNILAKQNIVLGDGTLLQGRVASLSGELDLTNNRLHIPADLEVTMQKNPGANGANRYVVGETITYTIKARNNGPVDEEGVKVMDVQFTGESPTFTSSIPGATFARDANTGMWVWTIGNFAYKQEATLTITATISATGNGFARAVISGAGVDEIRSNNSVELNFCVVLPNAGVISGPGALCVGSTGTYSIDPIPGATRYTWNVPSGWTYTANENTITVTAGQNTGVISVTVNNTCGESLPSRLEVSNFANPPAKPGPIRGDENVCVGTGVTYSIDPVANATSYQWVLPEGWTMVEDNGTTITVMPGGTNTRKTLQVRAINVCGVSEPSTREVQPFLTKPAMPSPITGSGSVCSTKTSTTFSIAPQNDATSYRWTVPASWSILSGQGTTSITVKPSAEAGSITVVAINACGDGPARTLEVTPVTAAPAVPGAITGVTPVCLGSTGLKYSVAPVATASGYTWYVPSGWTITSGQGTNEITVSVSATASAGKVTVQATNDCGASSTRSLDVTTVSGTPIAPLTIRGTAYGCANSTFTYETDPVAGASTYTWTVPEGWSITAGQGTTRITVTMGTKSGNVTVRASNACGNSAAKSLAVTPFTSTPIQPFAIKGAAEVCVGQQSVVYSLDPVVNTLEYIWAVPDGWTITSGQGTTSITVTTGSTGGYITVTASNDCGASAPATLKVNPTTAAPITPTKINGELQVCVGQQGLTYMVDPVPGAVSYQWTIAGTGWRIESGNGTSVVKVVAGTVEATISVVAINACGKKSPAQSALIVFRNPPVKPNPIVGEAVPCIGITYTYSVAPVAEASSYIWIVPTGWEIIGGANGTSITVKPNSNAGSVRVRATNNCGASDYQFMEVTPSANTPATLGNIKGEANACVNGTGTYSVDAVPGVRSYNWAVPAGWTITAGQGTATITVKTSSTGGLISVTPENDCGVGATKTKSITMVTSAPAQPGTITGESLLCSGTNQVYSIQPVAGASSYNWTFPGADWVIINGQGTTSVTVISGKTTGQVTVTALNGCGGSSSTLNVTPSNGAPAAPAEIVNNSGSFCGSSDNVRFSVAGVSTATSYTWTVPNGWTITSGQGTTSITVKTGTQGGEVAVSATNLCGKGSARTLYVAPQQPIAAPAAIQGPIIPCNGSTETVYTVAPIAGADSYLWTVPTGWQILAGAGTNSIKVHVSGGGTIGVRAKNSCGTTGETTLKVRVVTAVPVAPSAIRGETLLCSVGSVTYEIDSVATSGSYTWTVPAGWTITAGQGTTKITATVGKASGNVSVTADNSCGSSAIRTLAVTAAPLATMGKIIDRSSPCVGLVYEVEPVSGATNYTWTLPDGWTITSGAGTNRISVQAGNGTGAGVITVVASNEVCTSQVATLTPDLSLINGEVVFSNVFSPNNDGTNDTWEVANLMNYPDNDLTIINRWGNEVYRSKSYKNNWNGDNLAEGTYYYIARVKMCDGAEKVFKGFVMIVR